MTSNCPCTRKNCPRRGNCKACREHHKSRRHSVKCEKYITVRLYEEGDEAAIAELIAYTMKVSNKDDYSPEYIENTIKEHTPAFFAERAKESHFYVVLDRGKIIGCGGISGYWGSTTESYLLSVFILPEYQGRGIGTMIVKTLESDEYFTRAWRTEVGASLTAVGFYQKMGYSFKNGVTAADEYGVVRMEKKSLTEE